MHMADGFISPAVGCTMWAASAAITALCARKVRQEEEVRLVPLMGVLGAFIFACQMLNFTIPGTGSSGHLGGGLILAVLLGPYAGFLVMAAILAVQAGNDLLISSDFEVQIPAILQAVQQGAISPLQIDSSVMRILRWKQDLGLFPKGWEST